MTVNKNNCWLIRLTVLLFLWHACSEVHAQLKRNVLHIHFQTAVIHPGTTDTTLDTYYWIESYSPFTFTSIDYNFNFDNTKIIPEQALLSGTACDGGHGGSIPQSHNFYVIADNTPQSLDTTSKILFRIRYLVKPCSFTDSAMITPNTVTAGGFDSISIDNTTFDPVFQWHPFALFYADTAKVNIILSNDSTRIDSNSIKTVPIHFSQLDGGYIKNASFEFDFDTAAFDSVAILPGTLLAKASFVTKIDSDHFIVQFSDSNGYFTGQGELFNIVLRGKKRTDTLCTTLRNPKFTIANCDALVRAALYNFQKICVYGERHKDTVVTKGIVAQGESFLGFEMYPNPARSFIDFVLPGGQELKRRCQVFDMLGRKALDVILGANYRWDVGQVPAGIYTVEVSDLSETGKGVEKGKILIIH